MYNDSFWKELSLPSSFYKKSKNIEDICVTKITLDQKYTKSSKDIMNILVDLKTVNFSLTMRLLMLEVI